MCVVVIVFICFVYTSLVGKRASEQKCIISFTFYMLLLSYSVHFFLFLIVPCWRLFEWFFFFSNAFQRQCAGLLYIHTKKTTTTTTPTIARQSNLVCWITFGGWHCPKCANTKRVLVNDTTKWTFFANFGHYSRVVRSLSHTSTQLDAPYN